MVELLADPNFGAIAARYTSWPVNVPVRKAINRSKVARHRRRDTREEKCEFVLDDLLQVGSQAGINLRRRKPIDSDHPITSLAVDLLNAMNGVRNHPDRIDLIRSVYQLPKAEFGEWVRVVKKLEPLTDKTAKTWASEALNLAKLLFGEGFEGDAALLDWVETRSGGGKNIGPKSGSALNSFVHRHLLQAIETLAPR
jgi:hypothetical protein